ncbi:MAG: hypothetical protein RQ758_03695 [Methanomicrobiaceae archaeon]|nr:hypothetical protein [Methanomicrobiaceae archaeon]
MKCDLCGSEGTRFFRVKHEREGVVLLCSACMKQEKNRVRPPRGRGSCGC